MTNAILIFLLIGLAAFAMLVLGKVFAMVGMVVLFAEAVVFAFYMMARDENVDKGPSSGPKI